MTLRPEGLTVEGLVRSFDGTHPVLDGVDLVVPRGTTTALLGPSGCGKTTLLRLVAGLDRPESGTVRLGERVLTGPSVLVAPEHRHIGMVFQDWALFPHLDVARNVGFGLPRAERRSSPRIDAALSMVGLEGLAHRLPETLSGGQQQRVALARALAPEPSVLLLDEPFSNLDAALRHQVRTDVHRLLVDLGVTTVFVTHDQDEAFVLGDEVVVLSEGRVAQAGRPEEVYGHPVSPWVARFVGQANFVAGTATGATAATPFGTVGLAEPLDGPVEVLVRPESLRMDPVDAGGAGTGTVELVEFVGHSTATLVAVGDEVVRVRTSGAPRFARGDTVRLRLEGLTTVAWPVPG